MTDQALERAITISIHAPRMGSDEVVQVIAQVGTDFNPRSPHGERPRASRS